MTDPDKKTELTQSPPTPDESDRNTDGALKTDDVNRPTQQEHGGPKGLEPTRYGDWESNGRCTDF